MAQRVPLYAAKVQTQLHGNAPSIHSNGGGDGGGSNYGHLALTVSPAE
jgi:hypothetical protein